MKEKYIFCAFKIKNKDNYKPAHWVDHSKLRSLYIYELFKITPKFDENQASVIGDTEEEKKSSKNTIDYADENAE